MALTKERKDQAVAQYQEWLQKSEAVVMAEFSGLTMKAIDKLRADMREAGGEFHIIKNTLAKIAFKNSGFEVSEEWLTGTTALGIAFEDPPGVAKTIVDLQKEGDSIKIKGGFLGKDPLTAAEITVMAELPPLPVVRAQLLGTIMAPASKLTRTLAEPGRQLAQVVKAYSENEPAAAAA
ncbi:MAG: 50S ribosomal protein L10 [Anaerolineae bacterium]|nr:50S ribosomal protein L10 [Anaerolineae bacterium]